MILFDNAATGGRKPDSVFCAVRAALCECANAGRSGHKRSLTCAQRVEEARKTLCRYFNGYDVCRTVFTKNCTEALNIAIFSALREGGHAVTTCLEHNSVLRPLEHLKKAGKTDYSVCPLKEGKIRAEDIADLIRKDTKAVIVTSASNVTGQTPNLAAIKKVLPPDVLFLVDGAQGGGHIPIDVQKLGIDALTVAGHKGLFSIQGVGALLFSNRFSPDPLLFGGTGSESFSLDMPDFYPDRLESGTLAYPSVLSLLEGTLYAEIKGEEIKNKLTNLCSFLIDGLKTLPNYTVYSTPNPCGIVAFSHREVPSEEAATILSERFSIAVRGGLHCAPLAHRALKTEENGLIRASFSLFNTGKEVEVLLSALKKIG